MTTDRADFERVLIDVEFVAGPIDGRRHRYAAPLLDYLIHRTAMTCECSKLSQNSFRRGSRPRSVQGIFAFYRLDLESGVSGRIAHRYFYSTDDPACEIASVLDETQTVAQ